MCPRHAAKVGTFVPPPGSPSLIRIILFLPFLGLQNSANQRLKHRIFFFFIYFRVLKAIDICRTAQALIQLNKTQLLLTRNICISFLCASAVSFARLWHIVPIQSHEASNCYGQKMEKIQMATVIAQQAQSVVSQELDEDGDRDSRSAEERDRKWAQTTNKQASNKRTN